MTTIYHGTPLTPRAALIAVGTGRAMCVSFYRPDDVEVVEAISPTIMFRQWCILRMDGSAKARRGIFRSGRLDAVLSLVGAASVPTRSVGSDTRCARGSFAGQRRAIERLAVRGRTRCPSLAYGRSDQSVGTALRSLPACSFGMDWASQARAGWLRTLSPKNGRSCTTLWQPMAPNSHDAGYRRRFRLPVPQRRQHFARPERTPSRLARFPRRSFFQSHHMDRAANLRRSA